jgi:hypothetical protein
VLKKYVLYLVSDGRGGYNDLIPLAYKTVSIFYVVLLEVNPAFCLGFDQYVLYLLMVVKGITMA